MVDRAIDAGGVTNMISGQGGSHHETPVDAVGAGQVQAVHKSPIRNRIQSHPKQTERTSPKVRCIPSPPLCFKLSAEGMGFPPKIHAFALLAMFRLHVNLQDAPAREEARVREITESAFTSCSTPMGDGTAVSPVSHPLAVETTGCQPAR